MFIPTVNASANGKANTSVFYGLNRTDKGQNGEFESMRNMSSAHYPCLAPRLPRDSVVSRENICAVIAPKYDAGKEAVKTFTGVAENDEGLLKFFYNDEEIPFEDEANMKIPAGAEITLADFNGRIIICAYDAAADESAMYYYDYTATGADEDGNRYVRRMEQGFDKLTCSLYSGGDPDTDASVTNYLTAKDKDGNTVDWEEHFSVGDSVFITGFAEENDYTFSNNTVSVDSQYQNSSAERIQSCIVEKIVNTKSSTGEVTSSKLYVQLYNYLAERLVFKKPMLNTISATPTCKETVTYTEGTNGEAATGANVYIKIPTMNHICVHNNRLWGTNPNGEYLYASKLGDCFNWNTFQGLANDSFYAQIGTAGGFTGIVSYRDNLVAFKRDYIHHIYGDKPSNFTIPKQLADCGCIDIRSAAEVGGVLYFLGYNGFYEYTGGQPSIISSALNADYSEAVGMSDGVRYIVSARRRDTDEYELLSYDTRYGLWHKEDDFAAVGSFRWHNDLYMASQTEVIRRGYGTEKVEWESESVIIYENIFDDKAVNEIWIRARLEDGAAVTVYTSADGGDRKEHETLLPKGLYVYRVPVRFEKNQYFRYRLKGSGAAVIYDIERVIYSGGRPIRKGW